MMTFSRSNGRLLVPFVFVLAWILAIDSYVENWGRLKLTLTESKLTDLLVLSIFGFLAIHTYWLMNLLDLIGFRGGKSKFIIAFLPVIYSISLSLLILMPETKSLENPPFATYCFLTLIVFLNIPALAAGIDRARSSSAVTQGRSAGFPSLGTLTTFGFIGLIVVVVFPLCMNRDRTTAAVNAAFLAATQSLAVVAYVRRVDMQRSKVTL